MYITVFTYLRLVLRLRMRGPIPPLPHTSPWRGTYARLHGVALGKALGKLHLHVVCPLPLLK